MISEVLRHVPFSRSQLLKLADGGTLELELELELELVIRKRS